MPTLLATRAKRMLVLAALGLVAAGAVLAFLLWYNGSQQSSAEDVARKFAAALAQNAPSKAPENGDAYVRGVWKAYRRVDSAKVVGSYTPQINGGNLRSGNSYFVVDMLVHSGRGLVMLELSFDSDAVDPGDQRIDQLYELRPDRIKSGFLSAGELARVKADQAERGTVEDSITLSVDDPEATPAPEPNRALECVRHAHGDVDELQRCAALAGG
jgi:hypothetical protein